MAEILEARVRQKADTLSNWNNNNLPSLDGEQLFIRSDVDGRVVGFKMGSNGKKFSELPYIDLSVRDKATPQTSWIGKPSGVYIPINNGVYNSSVTVDLSEGYQVLFWDGTTLVKVVYPMDYNGLVFGGTIDDSFDTSTVTAPTWFIASSGNYNTTPPTSIGETSILTFNGSEWSHIPFGVEIRGEFLIYDNVSDLRSMTPDVAELLINGTYKGVTLLGYYEKGDTPDPINYYLSDTTDVDDGGSVFEVGGIKLEHEFVGECYANYFGLSPLNTKPTIDNFSDQINSFTKFRTYISNNNTKGVITSGDYSLSLFVSNNISLCGEGNVNIYFKNDANPVFVQFKANSSIENINFYSLHEDREWQRCAIEQTNNVRLSNCGFFNFLNPTNRNSWGLYLANCTNVDIDKCIFNKNTQSDIAIVDSVTDVKITYPYNEDGVYLNFEPNSSLVINNVLVEGGKYRVVDLLVNTSVTDPIENTTLLNCNIDVLRYAGANCSTVNCEISEINHGFNGEVLHGGRLDINLNLGENLIKDPYVQDYSNTNTGKFWFKRFGAISVSRQESEFTKIGNASINASGVVRSQKIAVDSALYVITINSNGVYKGTNSSWISRWITISFYSGSTVLGSKIIHINRASNGQESGFKPQSVFLDTTQYEDVDSLEIHINHYNTTSTNELYIDCLSLNKVNGYKGNINLIDNINNISSRKGRYYILTNTVENGIGYKKGDVVVSDENSYTITDGTPPIKYVSLKSGSVSNVSSPNVVSDTASTATDVTGVVTDLNDLISKYNSLVTLANELKTQLNAKLVADRDSGQQDT